MNCLIKIHDEIWCTLTGLSNQHLDELYNIFGPYVPGYRFMTKFKLGRWDGRVRFVQKNGKTYVKLLEKIIPYLSNWGYELDLDDNRVAYKLPALIDENIFEKYGVILRPHQVEGTNRLLEAGSAIGVLGTGLGKTFLTASLSYAMEQIGYRSIIVVPSIDLVNQTYESFELCGLDTGKYCGDEKDINHNHVISTWQSLQNNPFLLSSGDFKCIQWDECFAGDQLVETKDGPIEISKIQIGDLVYSQNKDGIIELSEVEQVYQNLNKSSSSKMLRLYFENGTTIEVTENHEFYTRKYGKVKAKDLTEDHLVIDCKISFNKIVKKEYIDKPEKVYDLCVKNNHNYFVNGILVSNCHQSAASVAQSLLNEYGKEIPYRFAVTGTFPKEEPSKLAIHSAFGDIVYSISTRKAMDLGYLTPVEIEVLILKERLKEQFPDYTAEKNFLIKSDARLDVLADLIINRCDMYGNTLVLVNSVTFGKKLASMIEGAVFLHGDTKTDVRKEHYDAFETENGLIRIATFGIASTGISINRVFNLMMIDPGKGFARTIQSIGRSLRLADDKDIAHVCDVYSNLKWGKKHAKEREKFYLEAEYPIVQKVEIKI